MSRTTYATNEAQNIALGQAGSVLAKTDAVTAIGGVFVAIQFIEDSVFESGSTGLVNPVLDRVELKPKAISLNSQ